MATKYMMMGADKRTSTSDPVKVAAYLDQFTKDSAFLESIREELQNKYPDCWVAVYDKQVVAAGTSLKEVIAQLDEVGVPKSRTVIDFLRSEPISLIL